MFHIYVQRFLLVLVLQDLPTGKSLAPWDIKIEKSVFGELLSAIDDVNSYPSPIAFSLCDIDDEEKNWLGGCQDICLVKELDESDYRLVSAYQTAVVAWKNKRSESYWNFGDHIMERINVWNVPSVNSKLLRDSNKEIVNPCQQHVNIPLRSLKHFAKFGSYVFSSGVGSGTDLIAALQAGYSIVATEPDERQFIAAGDRLDIALVGIKKQDYVQQRKRKSEENDKKIEAKLKNILDTRAKKKLKRSKKESKQEKVICFKFNSLGISVTIC